jgi:hypothetical protein
MAMPIILLQEAMNLWQMRRTVRFFTNFFAHNSKVCGLIGCFHDGSCVDKIHACIEDVLVVSKIPSLLLPQVYCMSCIWQETT